MTQKQSTEILVRLGRIEEGIRGVNEHLKKLNGTVAEHEKRLNQDAKDEEYERGKRQGVSATWRILGWFLLALLSLLGVVATHGCWSIVCHS